MEKPKDKTDTQRIPPDSDPFKPVVVNIEDGSSKTPADSWGPLQQNPIDLEAQ